ncbi:MAG: isoprenyl transferase [Flavobacteriaceae bacterium]|nr:isoprenyl transferase [Flavobacteriaceae bacterium]
MITKEHIDPANLPKHIAVIMDGNGRWAKQHNKPRVFGHKNGVNAVRETTEAAAELGIKYLTLYAFSTENWKRPALEVNALMALLVETLGKEISRLNDNNIQLKAIGDLKKLPKRTREALLKGIEETSGNTGMVLILALNYSGRWDITQAVQSIIKSGVPSSDITEELITEHLSTKGIPDPELLIRSSGEFRISNFLMWQLSYSELYFTPVFWPEFDKPAFYAAIHDYQNRERRFGMVSEQISTS